MTPQEALEKIKRETEPERWVLLRRHDLAASRYILAEALAEIATDKPCKDPCGQSECIAARALIRAADLER